MTIWLEMAPVISTPKLPPNETEPVDELFTSNTEKPVTKFFFFLSSQTLMKTRRNEIQIDFWSIRWILIFVLFGTRTRF